MISVDDGKIIYNCSNLKTNLNNEVVSLALFVGFSFVFIQVYFMFCDEIVADFIVRMKQKIDVKQFNMNMN
jgi:uncharacterized protein (DUF486 family)